MTRVETDERHTQPDLLTRVLYSLPVTPVRVEALVLTPPRLPRRGVVYHYDFLREAVVPDSDAVPEQYLSEQRDRGCAVFHLRFLPEAAWRDALDGVVADHLRDGYRITNGDVWLSTNDKPGSAYGCVPGARVFMGDAARKRWELTGPHAQDVTYYPQGGDSFITHDLDLFIVPVMGSGLNGKDGDVHLWWDNLGKGCVHGTYFGRVITPMSDEKVLAEDAPPRVSHVA